MLHTSVLATVLFRSLLSKPWAIWKRKQTDICRLCYLFYITLESLLFIGGVLVMKYFHIFGPLLRGPCVYFSIVILFNPRGITFQRFGSPMWVFSTSHLWSVIPLLFSAGLIEQNSNAAAICPSSGCWPLATVLESEVWVEEKVAMQHTMEVASMETKVMTLQGIH